VKLKYFLPSFIWALIILLITLIPASKIPAISLLKLKFADKIIHFSMFFIFATLLSLGFYFQKNLKVRIVLFYSFSVSLILASLTEILQHYMISGRKGDFLDMAANMAGIIAGLWMAGYLNRKAPDHKFLSKIFPNKNT
jgi:glycopeptide antibiotics resistance protein